MTTTPIVPGMTVQQAKPAKPPQKAQVEPEPLPPFKPQPESEPLSAEELASYSERAEESILGSVLINYSIMDSLIDLIAPNDFFILKHETIWRAFLVMHSRGDAIDDLTLIDYLEGKAKLAEVGGAAFITRLINNTPTYKNAVTYARLVRRLAQKRRGIQFCENFVTLLRDKTKDWTEVAAKMTEEFSELTRQEDDQTLKKLSSLLGNLLERGDKETRAKRFLSTPWHEVNKYLSGRGVENGRFYVLAARTGMGKTLALTELARHFGRLGKEKQFAVLHINLELDGEDVAARIASSELKITSEQMAEGDLSDEGWSGLVELMKEDLPIWVDSPYQATAQSIARTIRNFAKAHPMRIVLIDYVQLMQTLAKENRVAALDSITRELKYLAREFQVPIIAAAQVNRDVEDRKDKRPVLADLRESGALEQNADTVIFLYRDAYYDPNTEHPNTLEWIFAKQRSGRTGIAYLHVDLARNKIADLIKHQIDAAPRANPSDKEPF